MTAAPADALLDELTEFANDLADAARLVITRHYRSALSVSHKQSDMPRGQPVTDADRDAEQAMRGMIEAHYPDHGIIGEEHGATNPHADWQWVLDPIDGTRAFIAGLPMFGTLIGLTHGGAPALGIIDQPVLGERFVGHARGASFNTAPMSTRACASLDDAVFATTDPAMFATPAARAAYEAIRRRALVTQFGGNCYAYAMLAAGAIDIVVEADLKPWDVTALVPVIEAAGGVITGWDGGPAHTASHVIACGDRTLYDEVAPLLRSAV
jgi:myo-inositol-1(or 4)-monophosphatase